MMQSVLVVQAQQEGLAVGSVLNHVARRVLVPDVRGIGQIIGLEHKRQTFCRTRLKLIAQLQIGNGLGCNPSQLTVTCK